jgi:hypothetical protein
MNRVPRAFEWFLTHELNVVCFKQRNVILLILKNLIMINILTKMCATVIGYFDDRMQRKNEDYNVFVLYLTQNAWNWSLKRNRALLSNKFISFTWLYRDLIATRISNAANNEIYTQTIWYNRLQVSSTYFLLARRNGSIWKGETRLFQRITGMWKWHYQYLLTKQFPCAVGIHNYGIQGDIEAFIVSKPCVTCNAPTCSLQLNTKLSCKRILSFTFQRRGLKI